MISTSDQYISKCTISCAYSFPVTHLKTFQACKGCVANTRCQCVAEKGFPGEMGLTGLRGSQGIPGDIGAEGPPGPFGPNGEGGSFGGMGEKGHRVS
jgi:hypothetical protein